MASGNPLDDFFQDKTRFIEAVISLEWESIDREKQAKMFGVSRQTILNWEKKLDWEWVRAERQKRFARELASIDSALLAKAKDGSLGHIQLAYEKYDGFIPTTAQVNVNDKADDELKSRADELKAQLLARSKGVGAGQDLPGAGEARA